MRYGV